MHGAPVQHNIGHLHDVRVEEVVYPRSEGSLIVVGDYDELGLRGGCPFEEVVGFAEENDRLYGVELEAVVSRKSLKEGGEGTS